MNLKKRERNAQIAMCNKDTLGVVEERFLGRGWGGALIETIFRYGVEERQTCPEPYGAL